MGSLSSLFHHFSRRGSLGHDGHAIIAGASPPSSRRSSCRQYPFEGVDASRAGSLRRRLVLHRELLPESLPFPAICATLSGAYAQALDGLSLRRAGSARLISSYDRSLDKIRTTFLPLPTLPGTTDIYSYDQAHNFWRPTIDGTPGPSFRATWPLRVGWPPHQRAAFAGTVCT